MGRAVYKIGSIVDVCEYYAEGIPKCGYVGLITGFKKHVIDYNKLLEPRSYIIYDILDLDSNLIKTAEEHAIMKVLQES